MFSTTDRELSASNQPVGELVVGAWQGPDGQPISCTEKLKVLAENLAELEQLAADALDDAVLMGVDAQQVKQVFAQKMHNLNARFPNPPK